MSASAARLYVGGADESLRDTTWWVPCPVTTSANSTHIELGTPGQSKPWKIADSCYTGVNHTVTGVRTKS